MEFTSLKDFYLNNIHCHDLNHFVCEGMILLTVSPRAVSRKNFY